MSCEKCGKPLEDGSTICIDCASAEEVRQEAPVQEVAEETIALNVQPEPPVKKKKKGGLIALIVAAALVVAGAVAVLLNLDALGNLAHQTFDSPQEYMLYVEEKAADDLIEDLTEAYDAYLEGMTLDSSAASSQMHILLGDDVLNLLKPALQQAGLPADDLRWLSDVLVDMDLTVKDQKAATKLGIGLGSKKFLTLDVILDLAAGEMWAAFPDLSSQYLKAPLDLEGLDLEAGAELAEALPTGEALEKLLDTYYGIVLKGITNVEKGSKEMTVGGVSQKFTQLTAKITEKDLANIAIDLLEYAKTDATLEAVIDDLAAYINATGKANWDVNVKPYTGQEYTPVDMHAELLKGIEEALKEMQDVLADCDEANYLTVTTCIDTDGNIAGRELKLYGEDVEDMGDLYYITAKNGGSIAFELVAAELKITGSGSESGGKQSMTYDVTYDGTKYLTAKFTDVVIKDDAVSYTLVLKPESALLTDVLELDNSAGSLVSVMDLSLEISCDTKGGNGSVGLKVYNGEKLLVGITADSQEKTPAAVTAPASSVDAQNQQAIMQWIQGMKFDTVLNNMKTAGVPDALVQMLKALTDSLKQQ
ncbi:MAG: hypothetical protein J6Q53_07390 [Oscillospiraceae bacterium]|nr:hypothetical protein [Oscillospiraceae bacterium]